MNSIYGYGDDRKTLIDKMHGVAIICLYIIAIALSIYFIRYHQDRMEWKTRSIENSQKWNEALKKYYEQFDTTKAQQ